MSRININSNQISLNVQRRLNESSSALNRSFERLSSGLRINRAADDAAGLAVSSLLDIDKRVLTQGIRNLNDGISYLNIAESAITELGNVMFRIQEIAEQSANGTLSNIQRKPLQDEVTALQNEYNRIIRSTKFNGMQLLTGSNTLVNLQAGYGEAGGLATQIGNALVSDAFGVQSAGETVRVSTSSSGAEGNAASQQAFISADGNFVVFRSTSTNLVPGVSGDQIYRKNILTGELNLVSEAKDGSPGTGISGQPSISADGRFIAFRSNSSMISGTSVIGNQIYLKDMETGTVTLVSSSSEGDAANALTSLPNISADGRYVTFQSIADNLVSGTTGEQIYRKDMLTGELQLVSSSLDGSSGNGDSSLATISADGRFVAFRECKLKCV